MNVVAAIGRRLGKVREEPKAPDRFAKSPAFARHPQQPRVASLYEQVKAATEASTGTYDCLYGSFYVGGGSGGAGQAAGDGSVSAVRIIG